MISARPAAGQPSAEGLWATLRAAVPGGEVKHRSLDRIAYGADASHYALTPRAVVVARDRTDVASLLRAGAAAGIPLTFRSGGTSLSGQGWRTRPRTPTRRATAPARWGCPGRSAAPTSTSLSSLTR
jgi:D-lactate dehydrogenase